MKHDYDLQRFKTFRDKKVAHAEYPVQDEVDRLPSYHVMEELFTFGADYYKLVSKVFVGVDGPCELGEERQAKNGLKNILEQLGVENLKTEME